MCGMKLFIRSQISMVQGEVIHATICNRYNYLFVVGLHFIHVSKRGGGGADLIRCGFNQGHLVEQFICTDNLNFSEYGI